MRERVDAAVVGAGPAGLAAATELARAGRRTLLLDSRPEVGGQIWRAGPEGVNPAARRSREAALEAGVEFWGGTEILDAEARALLARREASTLCIEAESIVLATGARERFLPFPGWELPRVLGVGALSAMVEGGLEVRGKKIALVGTGPLLLAVADRVRRAGAEVVGIVEQARFGALVRLGLSTLAHADKRREMFGLLWRLRGVTRRYGAQPQRVEARGEALELHAGDLRVECDYVGAGFFLVPRTRLARTLGCAIDERGFVRVDAQQRTTVDGVWCAGEPTGIGGAPAAVLEGRLAGLSAAGAPEAAEALQPARDKGRRFTEALARTFALAPSLRERCDAQTVVCRCEGVRAEHLAGHASARAAKLQTRCGMGACQGRVCGPALEFLYGWKGTERPRPPLVPISVAHLTRGWGGEEVQRSPS